MPRISEFYGIAIYMYFSDHQPPHFHAIYGDFEAAFEIASGDIVVGQLPRRAKSFVTEWIEAHRYELDVNWERAQQGQPLNPIDPLD